jgi:beta-glucanase (GH16 family)
MTFSVDDLEYFTFTPAQLPSGKQWVFDHPFAILLDLAVGGNFVGAPDATTPFPQTMLVDYVRVYEPQP